MAQSKQERGQHQEKENQGTLEQARQKVGEMGEKAHEMGHTAADRLRDAAASAADTARAATQTAREQAEAGTAALGSGLRNLADTLRQNVPQEGMLGSAAAGLADSLERGGHYIEQEGMGGMIEDLGTVIRRNPLPAVLVGVGLGFLVGQLCRSER
jgi:hypothetical protein